jgi:hypothetical protein
MSDGNDGLPLGADELEAAILGGAILGGGGGGSMAEGMRMGRAALACGTPRLLQLGSLSDDVLIATVSLVGAPAAVHAVVQPADHLRAWQLLTQAVGSGLPFDSSAERLAQGRQPGTNMLAGVISCENGGTASVHGWLQAAAFGVPVVDAPADGRAHPTGDMGAMGLERMPGFESLQAAIGGSREAGTYVEQQVRGSLRAVNELVRRAAAAAGGLVAVARNPVPARYLHRHAAVGALSQALALGRRLRQAVPGGTRNVIALLADELSAEMVVEGRVDHLEVRTEAAYDVGLARVRGAELTIWNEYLTLEREGKRLATFPDLIITLARDSALPLTSAELALGREVIVLKAPSARLILGAGLRGPANYRPLENAVGRPIVKYAFPGS